MNFNSFYGIIALLTSIIFVVQVILTFVGGFGDFDLDTDTDTDVDVDSNGGSAGFDLSSLVSPKGILHFLLGSSWCLVLFEHERGGHLIWYDWIIAIVVGFLLALIIALVYWAMMKLAKENDPEKGETLVGRSGTIYLANNDSNTHIITTVINGASTELTTKSKSDKKYDTGDLVTILSYEKGIYYIE